MRFEPKGSGDEYILGSFSDHFLFSGNEYVMWRCVTECCLLSSDRLLSSQAPSTAKLCLVFFTKLVLGTWSKIFNPAFGSYPSWLSKCTNLGTNTGAMISISNSATDITPFVPGWLLWTMLRRSVRDRVTSYIFHDVSQVIPPAS